MNSCELVTFISAISCFIANSFTQDEIALFSAVFVQLGDSLATILANVNQ